MNENIKTIKELAEELGVSKQAIQYHIKSLVNKNRQTNDKGITVLSVEEQDFIRDRIDKQTDKTKTNKQTKSRQIDKQKEADITQYLLNEIEEVKKNRDKQLAVKDKQIENKDIQISQMQNLLDQQQQLTLQANQQIKQLQEQLLLTTDNQEEETEPAVEDPSNNGEPGAVKKWWEFWK